MKGTLKSVPYFSCLLIPIMKDYSIELKRGRNDYEFAVVRKLKHHDRQTLHGVSFIVPTVVDHMPSVEYVNDWTVAKRYDYIPIDDFPMFVSSLREYGIELSECSDIAVKRSLVKQWTRFHKWRRRQVKIRRNSRENKYNKYFAFMRKELYDFQSVGAWFVLNALKYSRGVIIGDKVGLGKTVISLAAIEYMKRKKWIDNVLLITPSSLKHNWTRPEKECEVRKFTDSDYIVIEGAIKRRAKIYESVTDYFYMTINYDLLHRDYDSIKESILKSGKRILVLSDEIQYIKNKDTLRSTAHDLITKHENVVATIGLSATLLENSPFDLYSAMRSVNPVLLGKSDLKFAQRYIEFDYNEKIIGTRNEKELHNRIKPYFIRRFKEDVSDQLPNVVVSNYYVELSATERRLYNDMARNIVTEIKDMDKADKVARANVLAMINYTRQCALSPNLVGFDTQASSKADAFIEFLETVGKKEKVVAFTTFAKYVEFLAPKLEKRGYSVLAMHGGGTRTEGAAPKYKVKPKDRIPLVNEFDSTDKYQILLSSDIIKEGINIPSSRNLVNLDLWFNPALIEQRIGRIDRITQKHGTLYVTNIIAENTADEDVLESYLSKIDMTRTIIDDDRVEKRIKNVSNVDGFGSKMTMKQISEIFRKYAK